MRVLDYSVYRGPHLFSETPMIRFMLDLKKLEKFPSNVIDNFPSDLLKALPGLNEHGCSRQRPGGFAERLHEGTWMGHIIEHIALELQGMLGCPLTRGKTRSVKNKRGVYHVLFAYEDEVIGLAVARMAIELAVRLSDHIFAHSGLTTGMTTTSGIYINNQLIKELDASGPKSARMVLADPSVDIAICETARGGILREGLAVQQLDVGVVLNISSDHLGLKGVGTLQDLSDLKAVVARQVRRGGTCVLNADDPLTLNMAKNAGGRVAYFTLQSRSEVQGRYSDLLEGGGLFATLEPSVAGEVLVLHGADSSFPLCKAKDIPITFGAAARFNIQNSLAAALATYALGVSPERISEGLRTFEGSFANNPGRLNVTCAPGFTTILDYAHNPAALTALGDLIVTLRPHYRQIIGVVSIPGDRRDEDILHMGAISTKIFDEIIFRERPDGRGRDAGAVVNLLAEGALGAGMNPQRVQLVLDEFEATHTALSLAGPDDLVVVMPTHVNAVWEQIQNFRPLGFPEAGSYSRAKENGSSRAQERAVHSA